MEAIIPYPIAYILAMGFMSLLTFTLFLNIFSLPANWIIVGFVGLWKYFNPDSINMDITFFIILIGLAIIGEILEFALQVMKAKKYGSSSSGTWAGIVGAIIGAILLAPLFFGIGALIGALIGAWIGSFIMEKAKGRPTNEATKAAFGAMVGRFLGTICKCGIGAVMLAVINRYVWPQENIQGESIYALQTLYQIFT